MLPKSSTFFSILLLFSLSTFISIKSSEEPVEIRYSSCFSPLSTDERVELIESKLFDYKQIASKALKQDIVKRTEGYHHLRICDLLTRLREEVSETTPFEKICYKVPTTNKRAEMIQKMLAISEKSAPEIFIQDITELTEDYNTLQINTFLSDIVEASEPGLLNQEICLEKLEEAINELNDEQSKKEKLARIEELRKLIKTGSADKPEITDEQEIYPESSDTKYPLIDDMCHQKNILFKAAAKQLKAGKFKKSFRRGMLLYGPPGVGKTTMVKAMANESNCPFFKISASKLVNKYQGSGAGAIQEIFAKAKAVEAGKGVIVFIDELESLAPRTIDENVKLAHQYSGQDHSNSLTQIWTEYDDCSENHGNILVIAASNKFEVIDKRIRDRFRCIKFSCPDKDDAYKILKNKAQHYNVSLLEAELQHHAKRMQGLSGRELATFIEDVEEYISEGKSKEKALELVVKEQTENKENAKSKTPNRRLERAKDQAQDSFVHGSVSAIVSFLMLKGLDYLFSSNSSGNTSTIPRRNSGDRTTKSNRCQ